MAELRVPVVEEEAHLLKTTVETDRVRVRTHVDVHEQTLDDDLVRETLSVERRAVERQVDAAPPPRDERDTTIISVVEERLVVTKQLFVVEEVLIRRTRSAEPVSIPVSLRAMRADIEHIAPASEPQQENH